MQTLPTDIIRLIAFKLEATDLARFFIVCRRHANISKDPKFWQKKLECDFCLLHGNLEPPFFTPIFTDQTPQGAIAYHKKFKDIYEEIKKLSPTSKPVPIKFKGMAEAISLDLETNTFYQIFWFLSRWLNRIFGHGSELKNAKFDGASGADPRKFYLRLYQTRCNLRAKRTDSQLLLDAEYLEAKRKMLEIEEKYQNKKHLLIRKADQLGELLIPPIQPTYHELVLSESVIKIIKHGHYRPATIKSIINLKLRHGTLIGIRHNVMDQPLELLIFVHINKDGKTVFDISENPERCPCELISIAKNNGWNERTVEKMYNLPFSLDFEYEYHSDSDLNDETETSD